MGKWEDRVSRHYIEPIARMDNFFKGFVYPPVIDKNGYDMGPSENPPILLELPYRIWEGFCALTTNMALAGAEFMDSRSQRRAGYK